MTSITLSDLESWEKELNTINAQCFVPSELLAKALPSSETERIVNTALTNQENISYHTAKTVISLRYLNDAYVWKGVLDAIHFKGQKIVELGPGTSVVFDLALSYANFSDEVVKVDYSQWEEIGQSRVLRNYQITPLAIDMVQEVTNVPNADLIVMNHGVDDLYMGLWAKDAGVDYFGYAISKYEENERCWQRAMKEKEKYLPVVRQFIQELAKKVNDNGFFIMKNYPSGFETEYRQLDRINFTFEIAEYIKEQMESNGLVTFPVDLSTIPGPSGSKFPDSFTILQKNN